MSDLFTLPAPPGAIPGRDVDGAARTALVEAAYADIRRRLGAG